MWKVIETKAREIRMEKTKRRRMKGRSEKEMRRERAEKGERKEKNDGDKESSGKFGIKKRK